MVVRPQPVTLNSVNILVWPNLPTRPSWRQNYRIGTARKMPVDTDDTPDLLFIQQQSHPAVLIR